MVGGGWPPLLQPLAQTEIHGYRISGDDAQITDFGSPELGTIGVLTDLSLAHFHPSVLSSICIWPLRLVVLFEIECDGAI